MRHQPRHAAVAIEKWMNPKEPMVRRSRRKNSIGLADAAVDGFKMGKEARDRAWANGDVTTYFDIVASERARNDAQAFVCFWLFDP